MRNLKNSFFCALVFFCGCTIAQLNPEGEKVNVVNSISATDLVYYDKDGTVECLYMADEANCINDLKNRAAAKQASIIFITSRKYNQTCGLSGKDKTCVSMTADAYKRKP